MGKPEILDKMIRYCHAMAAIKELIKNVPDPEELLKILEQERIDPAAGDTVTKITRQQILRDYEDQLGQMNG